MTDAEDRRWEVGWDGHRRAQRARLARLTLIEKLAWLEAAQELVQQLSRQRPDRATRTDHDHTQLGSD